MGICRRFLPLATVGDGNCLLHAASLGMWGYHDRLLTLRKALYRTLTSHLAKGAIKRRWRLEQWQKNIKSGGLLYSEDEWEKEWEEVLRIASTQRRDCNQVTTNSNKGGERQPTLSSISEKGDENSDVISVSDNPSSTSMGLVKNNDTDENHSPREPQLSDKKPQTADIEEQGGALESLEDVHVFVLAHVLRRPIVIIADQFLYGFGGEAIAPIPFGGVYLPLECDPKHCFKSPLVLAFDSAHFSPLVPSEEKSKGKSLRAAVPLVDPNHSLLPLQFAVDPGEDILWSSLDENTSNADKFALSIEKRLELLKKYLDVETLKLPVTSKKDGSEDSKLAGTSSEITSDAGNKWVEKKPSSKSVEKKEKSWFTTQILKVGTIAGVVSSIAQNNVYVARLQIDKKPDYYDKMIENYIQSAKYRFEEEKKVQGNTNNGPGRSNEKPQPCITSGCSMFGTSATNYLCSGCYKTQKSYSETRQYSEGATSNDNRQGPTSISENSSIQRYLPPLSYSPYFPYSYFTDRHRATGQHNSSSDQWSSSETPQSTLAALASSSSQAVDEGGNGLPSFNEVMELNKEVTPSGATYADVAKCNRNQNTSGQCVTTGCQFYGSPDSKGYCSACFRDYQKSSKYLVEDYESSKSEVV